MDSLQETVNRFTGKARQLDEAAIPNHAIGADLGYGLRGTIEKVLRYTGGAVDDVLVSLEPTDGEASVYVSIVETKVTEANELRATIKNTSAGRSADDLEMEGGDDFVAFTLSWKI